MVQSSDPAELLAQARAGSRRALGRLVSLVEDGDPAVRGVDLRPIGDTRTHVIGITGAPGVGKSSVTSALITHLRAAGRRVAVLAVDPSSPYTGGAILGDRVRMQEHSTDDGVYIRSMASRGHLGGIAAATPHVIRVMEALGFDVVIVETVGVGQSEVEIAAAADTTLVLLAPGMGDGIQAVKAGIVEIGDVFCVNKADRDGADATVRDLRHALSLAESATDWQVPILLTVATRSEGIATLADALDAHRDWLRASGEDARRRLRRVEDEVRTTALGLLRAELDRIDDGHALEASARAVLDGGGDPHAAATALVAALKSGRSPA